MNQIFGVLGVFAVVMAVPITAILTAHQRKMAELIARRQPHFQDQDALARLTREVADIRHEVSELKQMVHEQMIALDSYAGRPPSVVNPLLQQRMENR